MQFITDRIITLAALFEALKQNRSWAVTLTAQQHEQIITLLDADALERMVNLRLGNLHTLPWVYSPFTNEVTEYLPRGAVVLKSGSLEGELRGVLLAWLTGNQVSLITRFEYVWKALLATASRLNVFTPFKIQLLTTPRDASVLIDVPDDAFLYQSRENITSGGTQSYALSADMLASWSASLIVRVHHTGMSLSAARLQLPAAQRQQRLDSRLRFLLYKTRHLPYYQHTAQPQSVTGLDQLPILTKQALEAGSPPNSHDMGSHALASGEVLVSGASGGKARFIPYSHDDWQNMIQQGVQTLYDVGLVAGDRVINTLYGGHMYGGMLTSSQELALMPIQSYTTGQGIKPEELVELRRTFKINAIIGIPGLLDTLLSQAKKIDPHFTLEKVIYGGASWPEHRKQWLSQALGIKTFHSILAANDGAQIGYQSPPLTGAEHYLIDDYNYVEIVDDQGKPVDEGQAGHILLTNWQKFEYPLIRYKIGDRGRLVTRPEGGRVLEFLGRSDGLIILNGRNALYYQEVADLAFEHGVEQLQLTIRQEGERETLEISVEASRAIETKRLKQVLLDALPSLGTDKGVSDKLLNFSINVIQVSQLPRHPVSGKVRLVDDRRFSSVEESI